MAQIVKNLPAKWETWVRFLGREDSPGERKGYPLWYSCLGNPMDRGAWWVTVNGVTKSWTPLSDFHFLPRCESLISLIRQVLAQYTPVLGPCSLRHSAILPFKCPLCRRKVFAQFFVPVKMPLSFPFLQFFFPSPPDRGLLEAGNDYRPVSANHLALPRSFPSTACGRNSRAQVRGCWLRPGLGFLRGLWNFLETDWAV